MQQFDGEHTIEQKAALINQMSKMFGWMFIGLTITGVIAMLTLYSPIIMLISNPLTLILLVSSEFGLVWFLTRRAIKMEFQTAALAFIGYSVLNGLTLSLVFFAYTAGSIAFVFFMAAIFFATMSIYGIATKNDLSSMGSILTIGIFALIIVGLVNVFIGSDTLGWILSFAGVIIFLALTAYDSQKLKDISLSYAGTNKEQNAAIVGALILYLDFINLFLFILRILGKRR